MTCVRSDALLCLRLYISFPFLYYSLIQFKSNWKSNMFFRKIVEKLGQIKFIFKRFYILPILQYTVFILYSKSAAVFD